MLIITWERKEKISHKRKNNKTNGKKNAEGIPYLFAAFTHQTESKKKKKTNYLFDFDLNCEGETRSWKLNGRQRADCHTVICISICNESDFEFGKSVSVNVSDDEFSMESNNRTPNTIIHSTAIKLLFVCVCCDGPSHCSMLEYFNLCVCLLLIFHFVLHVMCLCYLDRNCSNSIQNHFHVVL